MRKRTRVDLDKHTVSQNIVLKISSFGLELWEKKHLARPYPLRIIGSVYLLQFDGD